jgi:CO/xanthine dehydrogenase Mo-binding subunit
MYRVLHDKQTSFHIVGQELSRVDGIEKVTGRAIYTADMKLPGMLLAGSVYAPVPHCKITKINKDAALQVPGVKAVLTFADIQKKQSIADCYYITDTPKYKGDAIAIIAAETQEALEQGIAAVIYEYEELPCVFTVEEALAENATTIRDIGVGLVDGIPTKGTKGNIYYPSYYPLRKGNVEEGFAQADVIIERDYSTHYVEHAYIENEAAVVYQDPADGVITVYSCCQHSHSIREFVADALNISFNRVRHVQNTVGGSFGGKLEPVGMLAARAALLCLKTKRPIKMALNREQDILESAKRHPFCFHYRIGATKDGRITAFEAVQVCNAGAYCEHAEYLNFRAMVHSAGPYNIPNIKTDTYAVFTNNTPSGAFRGYSSPQVIFAQEGVIQELAEALGISVVELKRRNLLKTGDRTATNQKLDCPVLLNEMMEDMITKTNYIEKTEKNKRQTSQYRKGIGLITCYRGAGLGAESVDAGGAMITAALDGSFTLNTGLAENGQGLHTAFTQIASEAMGINPEDIFFVKADTNAIPDSKTTVASRGTVMGAQSTRLAGVAMRKLLLESGKDLLHATEEETVDISQSRCYIVEHPERSMPVSDICRYRYYKGLPLAVYKWYTPKQLIVCHETGLGEPYPTYAYGVCIAEVTVDMETGFVQVDKVSSAHDAGTVVNPATTAGQVYGGIVMGMGFATCEEMIYKSGIPKTENLDTYIVPTAKDMPEMDIFLYQCEDPTGTYGAKSIGEPATEMVGAAIALAVSNAIGRHIRQLPASLERVRLNKALR